MIIPLFLSIQFAPDQWVRTQLGNGVSIEAPGKMADGGETGPVHFYVLAAKPIAYIASIYKRPAGAKEAAPTVMLRSFAVGMTRPGGGKIEWQKEISLSGRPGIDVQYTDKAGMRTHFRAFVMGSSIVEAGVSWSSASPQPKTLDRFLGSIRLPSK